MTSLPLEERIDNFYTIPPTPRIEKLRDLAIDVPYTSELDRERIVTRVHQETEGEPMVLRRAKIFATICREYPVTIEDDSLLAGYLFKTRHAVPYGVSWNGLGWPLSTKGLTEEEIREFEEEIRPYWAGSDGLFKKTRYGLGYSRYSDKQKNLYFVDPDEYPQRLTFVADADYLRVPHVCHHEIQQDKLLRVGFRGFIDEAKEKLESLDFTDFKTDPKDRKKVPFLQAVIIAMEAACEVGPRFAALAKQNAETERDPKRKEELLKMAEINNNVPAKPPETFWEALQCLWTAHFLHWWETPPIGAITLGRVDQHLYPYYEKDLKEGRITKEEAMELIDCFMCKLGEALGVLGAQEDDNVWLGAPIVHHIDLGGTNPDGSDATNDLSYMFLESMGHTRLVQPNLAVLLHKNTPDTFLRRALDISALGLPHPYFFNVESLTNTALNRAASLGGPPVTLDVARNCGVVGCSEPMIRGLDSGYVVGGYMSVPHLIEYIFTRGVCRQYNRKMGVDTGDPNTLETFDDFLAAFEKQVEHVMGLQNSAFNMCELVLAEVEPSIYQSALIGDCIQNGLTREEGGARYNHGAPFGIVGTPDTADCLVAIKQLVYDKKKITMDQLCEAMENDFAGYEEIHQMCLDVPKFGNGDKRADIWHTWVIKMLADRVKQYGNTRGDGKKYLMLVPLQNYVLYGATCGALPSGRSAGYPLSDGISPTHGSDKSGPIAILKSAGSPNPEMILGGAVLNMRLDPNTFESDEGYEYAANILRTFVEQGCQELQFNVVSSETLRAAQKEPERHKDLLVRVAGYSAYFCQLPTPYQDAVIARTEHGLEPWIDPEIDGVRRAC